MIVCVACLFLSCWSKWGEWNTTERMGTIVQRRKTWYIDQGKYLDFNVFHLSHREIRWKFHTEFWWILMRVTLRLQYSKVVRRLICRKYEVWTLNWCKQINWFDSQFVEYGENTFKFFRLQMLLFLKSKQLEFQNFPKFCMLAAIRPLLGSFLHISAPSHPSTTSSSPGVQLSIFPC